MQKAFIFIVNNGLYGNINLHINLLCNNISPGRENIKLGAHHCNNTYILDKFYDFVRKRTN